MKLPWIKLFFYEFMVQPIPEKPLLPERFSKYISVREILPGDPLLNNLPISAEVIEARFKQSSVCLAAFQKEEFIGYQWFCFGPYEEDEVYTRFVPLPESEAVFDYDIYLLPEKRFGLGFTGLWNASNQYLRNKGFLYTFSRVSRFNTGSRRAHKHLKCRCVGRAVYLHVHDMQILFASVFPFVRLSLKNSQSPVITLRPDVLLKT